MKQKIQTFCSIVLLAALVFSLAPFPIYAQEEPHPLTKQMNNFYFFKVSHSATDHHAQGNENKMKIGNRHAFCVEPHVINQHGDLYSDPIASLTYFNNSRTVNRLSYIISKGFETTAQTWRDVLITKLAVYCELGWTVDFVQDNRDISIVTDEIRQEIQALQAAASSYLTPAKLSSNRVQCFPGKSYELTDSQGVLSEYRIKTTPAGVSASIDKNKLRISTKANARSGQIVLEKENIYTGDSVVYISNDQQNLFVAGKLIDMDTVVTVDITPLSSLKLIKSDLDTGLPLAGVKFELALDKSFSQGRREAVTDSKGEIVFSELELAQNTTLYLREISTPKNYKVDNTIHEIRMNPGEDKVFEVDNIPERGHLLIKKYDQDTDTAPIEGVRFQIARNEDFTIGVQEASTDEKGELLFPDLKLLEGETIYAREIAVPADYILDPSVQTVQLKADQTVELIFQNEMKTASVSLIKHDDETGLPLAGATFELAQDPDFTLGLQVGESNSAGEIIFPNIDCHLGRTVYIREIEAPQYYDLDDRVHELEIVPGDEIVLEMNNRPERGDLLIKKFDQDTGAPIAGVTFEIARDAEFTLGVQEASTDENGELFFPDLKLLEDETIYAREIAVPPDYILDPSVQTVQLKADQTVELIFQNEMKTASVSLIKHDVKTGLPLAGATFELAQDPDFTIGRQEAVSNAAGEIIFPDIDCHLGRTVYIREIEAPQHYELDEQIHELEIAPGDEIILEMYNAPECGDLLIKKFDQDSNNAPIEGVRFEIARDEEFTLGVQEAGTNAKGELLFHDLKLLEGETVYVREKEAAAGYIIDQSVQSVRLLAGETVDLEFSNQGSEFNLIKTDAKGELLADVAFKFFDEDGEKIRFSLENGIYRPDCEGEFSELRTDAAGKIVIRYLPLGSYSFQESETLDGFTLDLTRYDFELDESTSSSAPLEIIVKNYKLPQSGEYISPLPLILIITSLISISILILLRRKLDAGRSS